MGVSRDPLDGRDKVPSSPVKEAIIEEVKEAIIEDVKEEGIKPKSKQAKAKPKAKVKITKQPVEEAIQEIEEEIAGVSQDPPDGRGKAPSSPIVVEEKLLKNK